MAARLLRASVALGLAATTGAVLADIQPLTLYQKTARAPLVVRARALSDSTRRPQLEVLHIYKGSCPSRIITILPHFEDNSSPTPWLRREVFRKGEESFLFLEPYVAGEGRAEEPSAFTVLNADQGKVPIPAEGAEALEAALVKIVAVLSLGQHDRQGEALRAFLAEKNPHLVEAGLEECRKFRLAGRGEVDPLLRLLRDPRPGFRAGALALLAQIVAESRSGVEETAPLEETAIGTILDHVSAAARLDAEEPVRRRAIEAIEAVGGQAAVALLDDIGRNDPSQNVRYEAQVAAHRLRQPAH